MSTELMFQDLWQFGGKIGGWVGGLDQLQKWVTQPQLRGVVPGPLKKHSSVSICFIKPTCHGNRHFPGICLDTFDNYLFNLIWCYGNVRLKQKKLRLLFWTHCDWKEQELHTYTHNMSFICLNILFYSDI